MIGVHKVKVRVLVLSGGLLLPVGSLLAKAPVDSSGSVAVGTGAGAAAKGASAIPAGQELVNLDFPEMTEIQDIIKAIALWTGKNVILDRNVTGKVRIISPKRVTKEEAYQAFLSALNLLNLTTVETGKVIKIMKTRSAIRDNLKTYMGSSWAPRTDQMITQIIPLKYIDAKQLQTTLSRIVAANSMIAYEPTNTLIVSDSGFKVRRILEIIELLDVQTQQPKVIMVPIKNADAKSVADKVNEIIRSAGGSRGPKGARSTGYGAFKVLTDERTNAVIIFGPPRTIKDVKALVKKFDIPLDDPSVQASIHVRPLDFADAKKLAATLSSLTDARNRSGRSRRLPPASAKKNQSAGISSVADLGEGVKITADESTNSLLITGSKQAYDALNNIIRKLDIRRSQLFVEVDILDINEDNNFQFGTSIFAGDARRDGTGTKIVTGWESGQIGTLVEALSGTPSQATVAKAAGAFTASPLTVGILSGKRLNIPGLGDVTPGALINFLKSDGNTKILASPHVLTSNNEEASISVGEQIFVPKNTVTATGVVSNDFTKEDVSLNLLIKPNISYSNYVTLKMQLESTKLKSFDPAPQLTKRKTKQIVTVRNGQTIVISGLVNNEEIESFSKIPLAGDIPIIGWLFRNSRIRKNRSNLIVFLTPHIVHGASDLSAIFKAKVSERDQFLRAIFGSGYKKSDLYKRLPKLRDGEYLPTDFDKIEDKRMQMRRDDMLEAMGLDAEEKKEEGNYKKTMEEAVTVPFRAGGSDVPADIPVEGGKETSIQTSVPPRPAPKIDEEKK